MKEFEKGFYFGIPIGFLICAVIMDVLTKSVLDKFPL